MIIILKALKMFVFLESDNIVSYPSSIYAFLVFYSTVEENNEKERRELQTQIKESDSVAIHDSFGWPIISLYFSWI